LERGSNQDQALQGMWGWRCHLKLSQGRLDGIFLAIPLGMIIILLIWILARCEMVQKNFLTRMVRLLLNRVRSWWYVDQMNYEDLKKRRAEFIGSIRLKNLVKGRQ
jgi:hypothetical protein